MARYPGATWRPVSGHTDGPMSSYRGAVLHVNQSNGNLYNWVAGDHDMSCHFEVYKDGSIEQYLDTKYTSWCQMAGNADWISIETEGYDTEALTDAQVNAIAGIMEWLNTTHDIPLQIANTPSEHGFGWHGMGGAAWGGHPDCPGNLRKAQRQTILDIAQGDSMAGITLDDIKQVVDASVEAHLAKYFTGDDGAAHQARTIVDQEVQPKLDAQTTELEQKMTALIGKVIHGDADHPHSLDSIATHLGMA
ncbi:MAG TPA: N-acetylmuramoyl-L-alanine amidase [Nocardioidaceae bacterium]|nr:N-acetylmuramoyl-L-alanine amidase [Nocardioidaceae bacterium]